MAALLPAVSASFGSYGAIDLVLLNLGSPERVIYVSGDTVWYEGVAEARRFDVGVAILHLGAARVPEAGPFHLTMTAEEVVEAARAFKDATIVPLHFEGCAHFSEGREKVVLHLNDPNWRIDCCGPKPVKPWQRTFDWQKTNVFTDSEIIPAHQLVAQLREPGLRHRNKSAINCDQSFTESIFG